MSTLPVSDHEPSLQLSERELQILEMVATGASNQQIARQLVISVNTVKVHLRNIFEKMEVQSRTEATMRAIQEGWVKVAEEGTKPVEAMAAPARTFLLPETRQPLAPWQQIYLLGSALLALALVFLPLIPQERAAETPNLPVIYAQAPTPALLPPADAPSNRWVSHESMPTKRAGLGLVALDGKIYAIGGVKDNNEATRSVDIYDSATNRWTEGGNKPTAAANIAGAVVDGKIYVPGGCTNEGKALVSFEIYDPKADSWSKGAALPEARCAYGLVPFQDKLYLFGGWNGKTFEESVFVYSLKTKKWDILKSVMPQAKGYVGAAVLNGTVYVAGGYNGQEEFNQLYVFESDTGQWVEKAPMHEKRGGLGLIAAANNLYAVGGGWNHSLTTSEKYDPASNTWTTFETPFSAQWRNLGLTAIDTQIYAIGGWNGDKSEYMDAVVSYQFLFQLFLPVSTSEEEPDSR
jgi:DNA-binding CsgD family transcriptional regulator/N-acetylneuraminic acid mutarotase